MTEVKVSNVLSPFAANPDKVSFGLIIFYNHFIFENVDIYFG